MHRFYCPNLPEIPIQSPGTGALSATPVSPVPPVTLDSQEAYHARKVLRLQPGETVALFDGRGGMATARIARYAEGEALLEPLTFNRSPPPTPLIDIAVTLPKGPRADDMVNALGQLGVATLIPIRSQRSTVDPRPAKLDRYHRAAIESAKQSGRAHVMHVEETHRFEEAIRMDHDVKLIAHPHGERLADMSAKMAAARRVLVLIGPEGGWTDEELAAAGVAGCRAWRFSPHILRIETAAVAAAGILGSFYP